MTTSEKDIKQKEAEMFLIVITDAVIHPRTVMIHMCNASLASRTMMWMRRLDRIALLALFCHYLIQVANISCIDYYRALLLRFFSQWTPFFFDCCTSIHSFHHGLKWFLIFIFNQCSFLIRKFYSTIRTHRYKIEWCQILFDSRVIYLQLIVISVDALPIWVSCSGPTPISSFWMVCKARLSSWGSLLESNSS